jgi:methylated-DNA-protein-cysteine methyltransferase-like protein
MPRSSGDPLATDLRVQTIWRVVAVVPAGVVVTYGQVALRAGLPRGARQVARALRLAPVSARLPWHRVVAAGGRIALPVGTAAYREQCRRLRAEGIAVVRGRVRAEDRSLDALLWGE